MRPDSRKRLINCFLTAMLSVALVVTMIPAAAIPVFAAGETTPDTETFNIAILSDIHYVSDALQPAEGDSEAKAALEKAELTENRMMSEIDTILDQALRDAAETDPDAMLVCGDLCSNGELDNEEALAGKLEKAERDYDTDIYVVNGNHDINMSYGADFKKGAVENATRTQASDFRKIYEERLGYDPQKIRYYLEDPTAGDEVKNYGGLSYATEIRDGITLIALDTAQYSEYSEEKDQRFGDAQKTAGAVSDGLLAWAEEQAKEAKAKGNLVLAMCHHSLIPHYGGDRNEAVDLFFSEYLVPDWEKVAGTLADAGVSAVLTGHSHANDISKYQTKAGNTIYDIQTAALCAYPCSWRTLKITIKRSGEEPAYSFDVKSEFIDEVYSYDEQGVQGDRVSFEFGGQPYDSLQKYSYIKTGLPKVSDSQDSLTYLAEFLLREQLYAIKTHTGGFDGFLQEELGVSSAEWGSAGKYSTVKIAEMFDGAPDIEKNLNFSGADVCLTIKNLKEPGNVKKFKVSLSYKIPNEDDITEVTIPEEKIHADLKEKLIKIEGCYTQGEDGWVIDLTKIQDDDLKTQLLANYAEVADEEDTKERTESGTLCVDLSGMAKGINGALERAEAYIEGVDEDDQASWDTNYGRTKIEKEAASAINDNIVPVFDKPLDENKEKITPRFIFRDALQAFARGDEESFVPEIDDYENIIPEGSSLSKEREKWNALIQGDTFKGSVRNAFYDAISDLRSDEESYPEIYNLLNETHLCNDQGKMIWYEPDPDQEGSLLAMLGFALKDRDTPAELVEVVSLFRNFGVDPLAPGPDEEDPLDPLTTMFADLQKAMTTDTNVTSDSEFSFDADWHPVEKPEPEIDRSKQKGQDGTAFGKGAAIEAAEAAIAAMTSDKDPNGTKIAPLLVKSAKQTKSSVSLTWKKASGAKKYVVYGSLCGGKNKMKKLTTTTGTSFNAAKLQKGKYNKFMVIAIDANNNVVTSSKIVHVATSGNKKAANPKKVVVKAKVNKAGKKLKKYKKTSKITLRAGSKPKALVKSTSLKATFTKAKKTKVGKHVGMRYESSNTGVATVSAKGKVTAKKKGTCRIYVYAQNGAVKIVTVKVR